MRRDQVSKESRTRSKGAAADGYTFQRQHVMQSAAPHGAVSGSTGTSRRKLPASLSAENACQMTGAVSSNSASVDGAAEAVRVRTDGTAAATCFAQSQRWCEATCGPLVFRCSASRFAQQGGSGFDSDAVVLQQALPAPSAVCRVQQQSRVAHAGTARQAASTRRIAADRSHAADISRRLPGSRTPGL